MKRNAIVWGAGGFVGGELLRLLSCHPGFEISAALSTTHAGKPISAVYPSLAPFTNVSLTSPDSWPVESLRGTDSVIFSAGPHKETMKFLPSVIRTLASSNVKIVDLSGDFRLSTPALYKTYYHTEHLAPDLLSHFVYGLPEINADKIKTARYVSNPGCFATSAQLAVLPLAPLGSRIQAVAIDSKTGSSGAGAIPGATTHHPNRMNNYRAYKQLAHQHTPEIQSSWIELGGKTHTPISFVPQMAPMVRGIFTTAHLFLDTPIPARDIEDRYRSFYENAPFVRLVEASPSIAEIWGTNRCDISITVKDRTVVVCSAIDNLIKGASGQAIQNANLMVGCDEKEGLLFPAPSPV